MEYFYKCICISNRNKIIANELRNQHEMNEGIDNEDLLNYLEPYKLKHPVALLHYDNLKQHTERKTPSMIIQNEEAYKWLVEFHNRIKR
jgi:hypothetical protein